MLAVPDLQVVVTHALIADQADELGDRVRATSVFPISRYFRALDFAVAAAGYNSFHELVGFGVPTAFVPNPSMPLDDQPARARWAADAGAALCLEDVTPDAVDEAVTLLADVAAPRGARRALPRGGAAERRAGRDGRGRGRRGGRRPGRGVREA